MGFGLDMGIFYRRYFHRIKRFGIIILKITGTVNIDHSNCASQWSSVAIFNRVISLTTRQCMRMTLFQPYCLNRVSLKSTPSDRSGGMNRRTYRWFSARLQYLQYVNNGDTAILHQTIDIMADDVVKIANSGNDRSTSTIDRLERFPRLHIPSEIIYWSQRHICGVRVWRF